MEGARDAVAADARLLLPLLDDPDPEVRCEIGHALAAVPGRCGGLAAAGLRDRLGREDVPEVRASLVLGLGELAIGSGDERAAAAWARTLWSSTARPGEVRLAAALARLCLVDGPQPAELFGALAGTVTGDAALVMARVPWIRAVDDGAVGLYRSWRRCSGRTRGTCSASAWRRGRAAIPGAVTRDPGGQAGLRAVTPRPWGGSVRRAGTKPWSVRAAATGAVTRSPVVGPSAP